METYKTTGVESTQQQLEGNQDKRAVWEEQQSHNFENHAVCAWHKGVYLEDICVAAGWDSPHTFIKYSIVI